jgi:hypothetical protein
MVVCRPLLAKAGDHYNIRTYQLSRENLKNFKKIFFPKTTCQKVKDVLSLDCQPRERKNYEVRDNWLRRFNPYSDWTNTGRLLLSSRFSMLASSKYFIST